MSTPSRIGTIFFLALMASYGTAQAVPSFARQTGLSCASCHTAFPQLTPYGREFKLHGYTTSKDESPFKGLQEEPFAPLSLMLDISGSWTDRSVPGNENPDFLFPDQMSLFYAGRVSGRMGAFVQMTYEGLEDHFSLDNADIRAIGGKKGGSLVYGLTLNNSPTVQDPWNSTPAWGFPFASSGVAPTPAAAARVDGPLAQETAGLGGYVWYNEWLYGEVSVYRSANQSADNPKDTIDGVAPYWRLAGERQWGPHALEIGTYGLSVKVHDNGTGGPTNDFLDTAVDLQYQHLTDDRALTVRSTFINEDQDWAAGGSTKLQTFRVNASYLLDHRAGGSLGYFSTTGDRNPALYQPAAVDGSRNGDPDSAGWIAELDYLPWENTRFTLQYVAYDKFNGASSNYDGAGRDASDNNTVFLNAWLNY